MRQSSLMLERLEKRFSTIESKEDRRSLGLRKLEEFIGSFEKRMKDMERLVRVSDLSAFGRIPSVQAFDPWASMGSWGSVQDLVYLDWVQQMEEAKPVAEVKEFKSAWGTAKGRQGSTAKRSRSAWLQTPFIPARVAGKPQKSAMNLGIPKTEKKGSVRREKTSPGISAQRKERTGRMPVYDQDQLLRPLQRMNIRAAVVENQKNAENTVAKNVLPMLSSSIKRHVQEHVSAPQNNIRSKSMASAPNMRMVQSVLDQVQSDEQVSSTRIAEQRDGLRGNSRGLRSKMRTSPMIQSLYGQSSTTSSSLEKKFVPPVSQMVQKAVVRVVKKLQVPTEHVEQIESAVFSSLRSANLETVEQLIQKTGTVEKAERSIEIVVETVAKKMAKTKKQAKRPVSSAVSSIVQKRVVEIFTASPAVQKQITRRVLEQISAVHQDDVDNSLGLAEATASSKIVDVLVQRFISQTPEYSVLVDIVPTREVSDTEERVATLVQQIQRNAYKQEIPIAKQLDAKHVERLMTSAKESLAKPSSTVAKRLAFSMQNTASSSVLADWKTDWAKQLWSEVSMTNVSEKIMEELSSASTQSKNTSSIQKKIEKIVQAEMGKPGSIARLVQNAEPTMAKDFGRSVLPKIVGESVEQTVLSSLVEDISKFANRELSINSLETQEKLFAVLDKAQKDIRSVQTVPAMAKMLDMVDVQPILENAKNEAIVSEKESKSPWLQSKTEKQSKADKLTATQKLVVKADSQDKNSVHNPTRPSAVQKIQSVSKETGLPVNQVRAVMDALMQPEKSETTPHSLENIWERATSPILLPTWKGMGTSSVQNPEESKAWRLDSKRAPVYPLGMPETTVLQNTQEESSVQNTESSANSATKKSPWLSTKSSQKQSNVGFTAETISGDVHLSSKDVNQTELRKYGKAKEVVLSIKDVQGKKASWLEENKTVLLDDGTVIHAKVAKTLGITPKKTVQQLPLQWTLEGVQLQSDHKSLPTWAKRASGKPQVHASPEFLVALAKTSSVEDVAQVILDHSSASDAVLPSSARGAIEQIRKEAYKSIQEHQERYASEASPREKGYGQTRQSKRVHALLDSFTGLKPSISTATAQPQSELQTDKVGKLAKQLENLVSLAENNKRNEARQGVRMAEDSESAVREGQGTAEAKEKDYTIDIEALRNEVLMAFEQELSLRSIRSFNEPNNTDNWW